MNNRVDCRITSYNVCYTKLLRLEILARPAAVMTPATQVVLVGLEVRGAFGAQGLLLDRTQCELQRFHDVAGDLVLDRSYNFV